MNSRPGQNPDVQTDQRITTNEDNANDTAIIRTAFKPDNYGELHFNIKHLVHKHREVIHRMNLCAQSIRETDHDIPRAYTNHTTERNGSG